MSQLYSLDYYRNFYSVARIGSISGAAKELGISQPALSMGIQNLEKQLGYKLLIRKSRGIIPTEEGRILFEELTTVFEHLHRAQDRIQELHTLSKGVLRIGVDGLLSQLASEKTVDRFQLKYPNLHVFINKIYLPEILTDLREGIIDCAILCTIRAPFMGYEMYRDQIQDDDFQRKTITMLTDDFIVGEKYKYLSDVFVDITRLASIPYIYPQIEVQSSSYYNTVLKRASKSRSMDLPISGAMSRLSLVQYNHGFTYFPSELLQKKYEQKLLFPVFTNVRMRQYDLLLLTHKKGTLSVSVSEFASMLLEDFRK